MKMKLHMGSMKPLAVATAFLAGASVTNVATALPGSGDSLGAVWGVVNESICTWATDVTVSGGGTSLTQALLNNGQQQCQLRTLVPTVGYRGTAPAAATGNDYTGAAMSNVDGELYEANDATNGRGVALLTPNRALMALRRIDFVAGADGSATSSLAFAVQPALSLSLASLNGNYTIISQAHEYGYVAGGLQKDAAGALEIGLGERNNTNELDVTFNGDGTCTIADYDSRDGFNLVKDPMIALMGEFGVSCFTPPCGQIDGDEYVAQGNVNTGTGNAATGDFTAAREDWNDQYNNGDGEYANSASCTYSVSGSNVTVNYGMQFTQDGGATFEAAGWSTTYVVSADLRYLSYARGADDVHRDTDGDGLADGLHGGKAVGMKVGGGDMVGKTYLFNSPGFTYSASTPTSPGYENPVTPRYMQEECFSRGSISFSNTPSGAMLACTYQETSTCTGRSHSGKEETALGSGNGTIEDNYTVFDGTPVTQPVCRWNGNEDDLKVELDVVLGDGSAVTRKYDGAASDNGEAFVLQGTYALLGGVPDVENPPLLPQKKWNQNYLMVGQQFEGSLVSDTDADGLDSYDEFVIANQVGATTHVNNDFSDDEIADIFFRNSSGQDLVWQMTSAAGKTVINSGVHLGGTYLPVGMGDFDSDRDADVLVGTAAGAYATMTMNDSTVTGVNSLGSLSTTFGLGGIGDIDADGDEDLVFYNGTTGQGLAWIMENGKKQTARNLGYINARFDVLGLGDIDADGDLDVLFVDPVGVGGYAEYASWEMEGGNQVSGPWLGFLNNRFDPIGTGDSNNDGDVDLYFQDPADQYGNREYVLVETQGTLRVGGTFGGTWMGWVATRFSLSGLGDYLGDGDDDMFFRDAANGENQVVQTEGSTRLGGTFGGTFLGYLNALFTPKDVGDYDGDGDADVLLRNMTDGTVVLSRSANTAGPSTTINLGIQSTAFTTYFE